MKFIKYLFFLGLAGFCLFFLINIYMIFSTDEYIYEDLANVPEADVALVLGARVYESGALSDALRDRVLSALELYENEKISRFLLSGDHGQDEYDEVGAMKDFLLERGVDGDDIFLDHAGFDTYDSVVRAREIFGVESVIVVTQNFHLSRAVYLAREMEMQAYGYSADRQAYRQIEYYEFREMFARVKSFFDELHNVSPRFLGEPVDMEGSGRVTWD